MLLCICCIDTVLKLSKILKVPTTKKDSGWGINGSYGTFKGEEIKKNCNGQYVSTGDKKSFVRFEVLTAVTLKIKILWDVTPYTVVDIYWQLQELAASINKVETMEASFCSEIPIHIYYAAWCHIPKDMHFQGFFLASINNYWW